MSTFKRMLATVGIGAAKVDLQIDNDRVAAGDMVTGVVYIQGGRVNQEVDDVYAFVKTQYVQEKDKQKSLVETTVGKFLLASKFTVEAEQAYEFPVSFQLPAGTPITVKRTIVWIQTGLDIKEAVDPKDEDRLEVIPHRHSQTVLDAIEKLGFRRREVACEYAPKLGRNLPFVQEFEFVPTTHFRSNLDELEVIFSPDENGVELLLQIDRKARGLLGMFAEATDTDESFVRCHFSISDLRRGADSVAEELSQIIRRFI
ncbi:sporulation protein [Paenibacillus radicis (ex Xue et al. 2023)]|uniref:Sporulation protein n=1 Tax=Paenibacillus radicis (ex Xue et al. 2023) TaxID=2972489 RepID=A0ABT1YQW7_9BACL|nr:sporulation protein [Paenibacillus radicis (ex Xue et al. 2023)]MCR8635572.1 sporulation protein [Paenibacillus radicis (ex Xue et al. 2023)]